MTMSALGIILLWREAAQIISTNGDGVSYRMCVCVFVCVCDEGQQTKIKK